MLYLIDDERRQQLVYFWIVWCGILQVVWTAESTPRDVLGAKR